MSSPRDSDDVFHAFSIIISILRIWFSLPPQNTKAPNIFAANIGAKIKPINKLEVTLDLWYGRLAEKNDAGDDVLGTEVDLWASYELIKGLNLKGTAAYMFAGDATYKGPNAANPYKLGIGLEILF